MSNFIHACIHSLSACLRHITNSPVESSCPAALSATSFFPRPTHLLTYSQFPNQLLVVTLAPSHSFPVRYSPGLNIVSCLSLPACFHYFWPAPFVSSTCPAVAPPCANLTWPSVWTCPVSACRALIKVNCFELLPCVSESCY